MPSTATLLFLGVLYLFFSEQIACGSNFSLIGIGFLISDSPFGVCAHHDEHLTDIEVLFCAGLEERYT